ncbi:FAD/NAD(P)-binding protein [Actinoplanes couchii]|uniref:FAD/NAD(P)-binding protein n=1 Tax=Actinoplanes couchii TaxID=403638 RepID=UPI001EF171DD|nr:FAD/NAD(P)-binding protein [Actinoplanes couchii]MDR6320842.1 putative NAD(P)/FAD-binding protein YdhS [Actinoplanes couchii]
MTSTVVRDSVAAARTGREPGTVAIIGGGASGALTARAIARNSAWRTVLISPESRPGRGVAYGPAEEWHLLNSRAAAMSADSTDPQQLLRWCRERGIPADAASFLPRPVYGDYLADQFASAAGPRLSHHRATALAVRPDGPRWIVTDDTGAETRAEHLILALGNPAPCVPSAVGDEARDDVAFVADPWAPGALDAVPADQPVLLLGTGLTAIDVALTLTRDPRAAPLEALSRRGMLPRAHPAVPAPAVDLEVEATQSLSPLIRRLRQAVADGAHWSAVMDTVRHQADRLWAGLDTAAQERFLRHAQRYWEVHRHRMAPPVAARITALRDSGALRVRSGRLTSVEPDPRGGLLVRVEGEQPKRYGAVITCTGPGPLPCSGGPLLKGMFDDGLLRTGPHALGVDTDDDGQARPGLWLVGPLRRGRLWESTAVPEIRSQAERLAAALPEPAEHHLRTATA